MLPPPPPHALCALPPRAARCGTIPGLPAAGEISHTPILPPTEWDQPTAAERSLIEDAAGAALDQAHFPSCYAHAAVKAHTLTRALLGLAPIEYSANQLAARAGGRYQGFPIDSTATLIMTQGLLPRDLLTGDPWDATRWPPEWKSIAAQHRLCEGTDCRTIEAVASFLTVWRTPVILGYDTPRGGHAVTALYLTHKNAEWHVRILNSWGENWGDQGRADVPPAALRTVAKYGAIGWRIVTRAATDPHPNPPAAPS